jgi:glycosyltransferase involved in cell wall biosynthesis
LNFVIVANAWGAGLNNPTSKHQVALELARQGHHVLWVEGAGMRKPSLGSGSDRGRIARKILAALQPARRVWPEAGGRGSEAGGRRPEVPRGSVHVIAPLLIPIPSRGWIRLLNAWIYFVAARFWCLVLGFKRPVLINYVPVLAEVERLWKRRGLQGYRVTGLQGRRRLPASDLRPPTSVIYHCVDRWDAFGTYDAEMMRKVDEDCCRFADLVLATAGDLYERCKTYNANTHLLLHGVNYEHFAQALSAGDQRSEIGDRREGKALRPPPSALRPPDLPQGQIVGFFGLLSEWVDQELLVRLAQALREPKAETGKRGEKAETGKLKAEVEPGQAAAVPGSDPLPPLSAFSFQVSALSSSFQLSAFPQIVLIGNADVNTSRLTAEPNIHLLGPKPFAELPRYVAFFDVGIIPFLVNELTSAVNPIKLREMLAAGCPVVSTALPEVERYAKDDASQDPGIEAVRMGHDSQSFVRQVLERLSRPLQANQRAEISRSMAGEGWDAKVREIVRLVGDGGRVTSDGGWVMGDISRKDAKTPRGDDCDGE